jgi:hypothetical protein
MPVNFGPDSNIGNYSYYTFSITGTEKDFEEFESQSSDVEYISMMKLILDEVLSSSQYMFMSIKQAAITVDHDFFTSRLKETNILDYTCNSLYPGYLYEPDNYDFSLLRPINVGHSKSAIEPLVYRIDRNAMTHFGLTAETGRLFFDVDFVLSRYQTEIPILLGSEYRSYFEIGDRFDIYYGGTFQAHVVGFLQEETFIITDQILPINGHPMTFDYAMIVPFFHIQSEPNNHDEKMFAEWNYEDYLMNGMVVVDKDTPRSHVIRIEKQINASFIKTGLYPIHFIGSPYGLEIFKKESEQAVEILLYLVLIIAAFSVICICLFLTTKIDQNLRRYAIQIMNGQSIFAIVIAYILNILTITFSSMCLTLSLLRTQIQANSVFLFFNIAICTLLSIAISTVIVIKLNGIDIEKLIRRSE